MKKNLSFALAIFSFISFQSVDAGEELNQSRLLLIATLNQDIATMRNCLKEVHPDYQCAQSGHTALHLAITNPQATIILLKAEADPDLQDHKGKTPLHLAAKRNRAQCAYILLKTDANPNIQDNLGNTPLHYSIMGNHAKLTFILLKNGASESVPNHLGITPQDLAATACTPIQEFFFLKKAARKK